MSQVPAVRIERASYENLLVDCPWCGEQNIFNRASDLNTFEPILGRDVTCLNDACRKVFRITSDAVGNPHEMLIYDCNELIQRKHFMNCVLSVAQAYEMFFALYFRVEMLYRPFVADTNRRLDELNRLAECLEAKLKRCTFVPMRALFLTHVMDSRPVGDLAAAATEIAALPDRPKEPKISTLDDPADLLLSALLKKLKNTDIHEKRNDVVHKRANRPTAREAQDCLDEARAILFPLTRRLDLREDVNWYRRSRRP